MTGYAQARHVVADALASGVGDDWLVLRYPADRIGDQAILVAGAGADALNHCTWRRRLILGVFVRRHVVEESLDVLDQITPIIRSIVEGVPGGAYDSESPLPPTSHDLGGTEYLIQTHKITIETTN